MSIKITLPALLALSLIGCGGGGGSTSGGSPGGSGPGGSGQSPGPTTTLGGKQFDGASNQMKVVSASDSSVVMYQRDGDGETETTSYAADVVQGVATVKVTITAASATNAPEGWATMELAKATDGAVYLLAYTNEEANGNVNVSWVVGGTGQLQYPQGNVSATPVAVAVAVPETFLPSEVAGQLYAGETYTGGLFVTGPWTIGAVNAVTGSGEVSGATEIDTDGDNYWYVPGRGIVEIGNSDSPTAGFAMAPTSNG